MLTCERAHALGTALVRLAESNPTPLGGQGRLGRQVAFDGQNGFACSKGVWLVARLHQPGAVPGTVVDARALQRLVARGESIDVNSKHLTVNGKLSREVEVWTKGAMPPRLGQEHISTRVALNELEMVADAVLGSRLARQESRGIAFEFGSGVISGTNMVRVAMANMIDKPAPPLHGSPLRCGHMPVAAGRLMASLGLNVVRFDGRWFEATNAVGDARVIAMSAGYMAPEAKRVFTVWPVEATALYEVEQLRAALKEAGDATMVSLRPAAGVIGVEAKDGRREREIECAPQKHASDHDDWLPLFQAGALAAVLGSSHGVRLTFCKAKAGGGVVPLVMTRHGGVSMACAGRRLRRKFMDRSQELEAEEACHDFDAETLEQAAA